MVNTTDPFSGEKLSSADDDEDSGCCFIRREITRKVRLLEEDGLIEADFLENLGLHSAPFGVILQTLDDIDSCSLR